MAPHKCYKEKEIDALKSEIASMKTDVALIKQEQQNQGKKQDEIHEAVVGKGDTPGLKGRMEKIETTQSNTVTAISIITTIVGAVLGWLAFFKK